MWRIASVEMPPPVTMSKCGTLGLSKNYPVLVEGFKEPMMGFYYVQLDFALWKVNGYNGRREVLYYHQLPDSPDDHKATLE